jgi:hypothetical protein
VAPEIANLGVAGPDQRLLRSTGASPALAVHHHLVGLANPQLVDTERQLGVRHVGGSRNMASHILFRGTDIEDQRPIPGADPLGEFCGADLAGVTGLLCLSAGDSGKQERTDESQRYASRETTSHDLILGRAANS